MHNSDTNFDLTLLSLLLIFSATPCCLALPENRWSSSTHPALGRTFMREIFSKEKNLPVRVQLILNMETGCSLWQDEEWRDGLNLLDCITVSFMIRMTVMQMTICLPFWGGDLSTRTMKKLRMVECKSQILIFRNNGEMLSLDQSISSARARRISRWERLMTSQIHSSSHHNLLPILYLMWE